MGLWTDFAIGECETGGGSAGPIYVGDWRVPCISASRNSYWTAGIKPFGFSGRIAFDSNEGRKIKEFVLGKPKDDQMNMFLCELILPHIRVSDFMSAWVNAELTARDRGYEQALLDIRKAIGIEGGAK